MSKKNQLIYIIILSLIYTGLLLGCGEKTVGSQTEEMTPLGSNEEDVAERGDVEKETPAEPDKEETVTSPEPQVLEFSASDGTPLSGKFYPAGNTSAPLVILLHWAPGDQEDWVEIAYWLQNRGLTGSSALNDSTPWLDASWFPRMADKTTYNVLTFTFRNCVGGCSSFEREKWYLDVQAAVDLGMELESVDTSRVVMIGASIGSDGAVDGCAYLNENIPGSCRGAISLSPGNYLTIDYAEKVKELATVPVWCLYAESDFESAPVCRSIEESNFTEYSYPADMIFSNGHGMNLIEKNQDPNPLDLIINFLGEVL